VTHDLREAFLLASRIGLLKDGRLVFLGQPRDLLDSDDPEARAFTSSFQDPAKIVNSP
jgi:osmoprotectant transport system ATP-binding protein